MGGITLDWKNSPEEVARIFQNWTVMAIPCNVLAPAVSLPKKDNNCPYISIKTILIVWELYLNRSLSARPQHISLYAEQWTLSAFPSYIIV